MVLYKSYHDNDPFVTETFSEPRTSMAKKQVHLTPEAVVQFAKNGLKTLSDKYGGDCTLNEARVMVQIIQCHLAGRTCSVTALHRATGIPIPTVSRAVANLQREGWLADQRDPNDGRRRVITFGPRSLESTPGDIEEATLWLNESAKRGASC